MPPTYVPLNELPIFDTFTYKGETFNVYRDSFDTSLFGTIIQDPSFGWSWDVTGMGEEAFPELFNMTLEEMETFILLGIEFFEALDSVTPDDMSRSDYHDFFCEEFDEIHHYRNREMSEAFTQAYVVKKLHCLVHNARWNSQNDYGK